MNNEIKRHGTKKGVLAIIPVVFAIAITLTVAAIMNKGQTPPLPGGQSTDLPPISSPVPVDGTPQQPPEGSYSSGLEITVNPDGTATVNGIGSCADRTVRIPHTSQSGAVITSIADSAFASVRGIDTVVMPDSVVSIGAYAFKGSSITRITVGSSVLSIGSAAFADCLLLEAIEVDGANPLFASVNGVLFNREITVLHCYPAGRPDSSYTIPSTVTEIRTMALHSCNALKKLKYDGNAKRWASVYVAAGNTLIDNLKVETITSDK